MMVFGGLVPDLTSRRGAFAVDASEVDDELLTLFREHIGQLSESLGAACRARNEMDIRRDAHSLLGIGGTIGVPSLSVVAQDLSAAAKGGDFDRCAALSGALCEWVSTWPQGGGDRA